MEDKLEGRLREGGVGQAIGEEEREGGLVGRFGDGAGGQTRLEEEAGSGARTRRETVGGRRRAHKRGS